MGKWECDMPVPAGETATQHPKAPVARRAHPAVPACLLLPFFPRRLDRKWRLENMAIRGERLCHILDDGSEEDLALLLLSTARPLTVGERHHAIEVITPAGKIEFQVQTRLFCA